MPVITVKIPSDAFAGTHRAALMTGIVEAAAAAEQIPDEPMNRLFCMVSVEEATEGNWVSGSIEMSRQTLPCLITAHVPAGVLDARSRSVFAELIHRACVQALPENEKRNLITSLVIQDVSEGSWGINGAIWDLKQFAEAAGYTHLPLGQTQ